MNAREIAFSMLKDICLHNTYSNLLLRKELNKAKEQDKGLITQIVYGTLQNYRLCRYQWEDLVKKLPSDDICVLLDMSIYQLFYMDKVPAYAIINEAVEITKKSIHPKMAKMVNAVLHQAERRKEREVIGNEVKMLAIKTSHPEWIVSMWKAQYGMDVAEKICYANMETKPNAARVNTWKTSKEKLLAQDERFHEGYMSKDALLYDGSIVETSSYEQGLISIQDEASQLIARIVDPQPDEEILDVCSAPGTKANHMAELMQNKGHIVCGDLHPHRVELIREGAKRLGITIMEPMVMDATELAEIKGQMFDRVLCDVPCSGYGVLARKSDIKYHMKSEDMDTLIPIQKKILSKSAEHVKLNGILVYSTCTLNKKENEKQIQAFLKEHDDFMLVEERTIFPFEAHSDGFYMAKLQRKQ
ncbi:MAG: 16S rRNA (cytosine(967)-C(5))-methyltransferase RsmB [Clostridium sp.]